MSQIPCRQYDNQASSNGNLARHKIAVHEGVKYSLGQCDHQITSESNLAQHKRSEHEEVKFPDRQCDHQARSKGYIARHKKAVHEGSHQQTSKCILNTRKHFMKESSINVGNVTI